MAGLEIQWQRETDYLQGPEQNEQVFPRGTKEKQNFPFEFSGL